MKITEVVILAETNELQSRIIQHLEKNSVWGAWYAHDVLHIPDVYTSKQKEIDIILNHSGYRIDKYIFADENDMVESLAKGHPNYKAQQAAIHISKAKNKVKEKISKNASAGEYVKDFRKSVPRYMLRLKMKAGLTGWAQVNGWRGNTSLDKRIEFDLYYIKNWSLLFDLKIILMTFWKGFVNPHAY